MKCPTECGASSRLSKSAEDYNNGLDLTLLIRLTGLNNNMRHILIPLIFLLSIITASAAPVGNEVKIHGKIIDEKNEPLEFVTVRIAGTAVGTMSGLDGGYSISTHRNDTITIVFTCIGFREVERKLIDAADDVTLNISMHPSSRELSEIEVTDFKIGRAHV